MNVACDYEAPMQMITTEKYIAPSALLGLSFAKMAYSPSINARLIEAYEKRDHVDPV